MSTFAQGHALVIGVGDDFPGTVDDAKALADILTTAGRCAYPPNQVKVLTGEDATRRAILDGLDKLAQASENAAAVVYFSGHGYRVKSAMGTAYFLLPYGYDEEDLAEACISGAEFTERLRAFTTKKLLILLDCCRAGGIGEPKSLSRSWNRSAVRRST